MFDGCLADFNKAYGELFIELTGRDLFPAGWHEGLIKNEFPLTWSWEKAAGYSGEETSKVWKHITTSEKFWASLEPLGGAIETIQMLNELSAKGHDVYFITNRMGKNAKLQTEDWLFFTGGMTYPTVILSGDKAPLIKSLGLDFFVDDKLVTIHEIYVAREIDEKERRDYWDLTSLYLKDSPYNREGRLDGDYKVVASVKDALIDYGVWE